MSGELDFQASLDIKQLKADIQKVQGEFAKLSNKAEIEGARIDSTFKRIGAGMVTYFGAQQMLQFGKSILDVRGEFQQLEVAFTTMLKSKSEADKLMSQIATFAATTPYELQDVGKGAKQLLAFQVPAKDIVSTLKQIGDLASGTGAPLNDLVSIYGKVKAKGKLQAEEMNLFLERGIPLVSELAKKYNTTESAIYDMASKGKIGFSDLQGVISNLTSSGGMFFNLMEEQSKTITGQLSNLSDAWDAMLNTIGKNSEGVINSAIDSAKFLVDNYAEIAKIIGVLITTYGAYKAALMVSVFWEKAKAASVVQSALAGRALSTWEILHTAILYKVNAAQKLLNRTMMANPYALAAAAIAGIIAALVLFSSKADAASIAQEKIGDALDRANEGMAKEQASITSLVVQINNENISRDERNKKLQELIKMSPEHLKNLTLENIKTSEGTAAIEAYIYAIRRKMQMQELEKELNDSLTREISAEGFKNDTKWYAKITNYIKGGGVIARGASLDALDMVNSNMEAVKQEKQIQQEIAKKMQEVQNLQQTNNDNIVAPSDSNAGKSTKDKKDYTNDIAKQKEELAKAYKEMEFAARQAQIDGMNEGLEKVLAQNEFNFDKQLSQLEEQKQERLQKIQEIEKLEFLKSGGKETDFKPKTTEISGNDKAYFDALADAEYKSYTKANENAINEEKSKLDKLALEFENYQQRKLRISDEYNKKISQLEKNNNAGEYDDEIKQASNQKDAALLEIDKEIANKEAKFIVWSESIANAGLKELINALEVASRSLEASNITDTEKSILKSQIAILDEKIKIEKARAEIGDPNIGKDKWKGTLKVLEDVNQTAGDIISTFDGISDTGKAALDAAQNIASGVITMITSIRDLSIAGAEAVKGVERASLILAVIGAAVQMISKMVQLTKQARAEEEAERQAYKDLLHARIQTQRVYNNLLREQILLMKDANSIFGTDSLAGTLDTVSVISDLMSQINAEKGTLFDFGDEPTMLQYLNIQFRGLLTTTFVEGKGYVQDFNVELAKSILETQELSKYQRDYLQNLVDMSDQMEDAQGQLNEYLETTFGSLGGDMMDSIVKALSTGVDAWKDFENAGANVLENLGKQIAYNIYFADIFKDLERQLQENYNSGLSNEQITDMAANTIEDFYNGIGGQMDQAQNFMEQWDEQLQSFDLWSTENREATQKGFASMSQNSADELNGRFSVIQSHTFEINNNVRLLATNSSRTLQYLAGINSNTARLETIETDMKSVKSGIEIINTKGIKLI